MTIRKMILFFVLVLASACSSEIDEWVLRLEYRNPDIRVQAAEYLGSHGDRRAVPALIKALGDSEVRVRFAAAGALGKLEDKRAVDTLVARVSDSEMMVALEAVAALAAIGGDRSLEALQTLAGQGDGPVRLGALESLGLMGDARSVEVLGAALEDTARSIRWGASMALGKVGDARGLRPLVEALANTDEEVRVVMITALEQIDPSWRTSEAAKRMAERLVEGLKKSEELASSQYGAIQALQEIDPEWKQRADVREIRDFFVRQSESADLGIRRNAIQALGDLGDNQVIGTLLKATDDPSPQVRYMALGALGKIGPGRASDSLLEALNSKDPGTVSAVAQALGGLGDSRAVLPLIAFLKETNTPMAMFRLGAIQTLGGLKDARAVDPLTKLLSDPSIQTRRVAAEALGEIGSPKAVAPLVGTLNDMSAGVRWAAADALGKIGDPSAVDTLIAVIGAGRIWSRRMVLVLDNLDANWRSREATTRVVAYFVEQLNHPVAEVRWRSAEALGQIANPQASRVLMGAMAEKHVLVMAAAHLFFIRNGVFGSEQLLVDALNLYGTEEMALTFLNAGHPLLGQAARAWARKQETVLLASPKLGNIHWKSH